MTGGPPSEGLHSRRKCCTPAALIWEHRHVTAQGDEWDLVTSDGEALHMQYGSALDDFNPVNQVRMVLHTPHPQTL